MVNEGMFGDKRYRTISCKWTDRNVERIRKWLRLEFFMDGTFTTPGVGRYRFKRGYKAGKGTKEITFVFVETGKNEHKKGCG